MSKGVHGYYNYHAVPRNTASREAFQREGSRPALAPRVAAPKPATPNALDTFSEDCCALDTASQDSASASQRAIPREAPEVGAVCGISHVRICAGSPGQPGSLPRPDIGRPIAGRKQTPVRARRERHGALARGRGEFTARTKSAAPDCEIRRRMVLLLWSGLSTGHLVTYPRRKVRWARTCSAPHRTSARPSYGQVQPPEAMQAVNGSMSNESTTQSQLQSAFSHRQ